VVLVTVLAWQFRRPPILPPLTKSGSPTVADGAIRFGPCEPPAQPEPAALVCGNKLSHDALVALVVTRLREWEDQDDSALRSQRLREMEALLDGTNMLEIVQDLPSDLMGYVFALPSLRQKLMSDPKAALDWMSCHTNVSGSQMLTLLHDWGQENREEMRQYLAELPASEWKQTVMANASDEALSSDPVEAITWAGRMNPGERQTGLLEMATTDWVKRDPDAAAQWAGQVSDPVLREQLLGAVAVGYADIDPLVAAHVVSSMLPGSVLDCSVAGIAGVWSRTDPAAAAAWVEQIPEGQAQQMALGDLMNVWGNHDPAAATSWIEQLPEGPLQTSAARDLLTAMPTAGLSAP